MSQFTIHVPEFDPLKRYCIAKFNPNLNVDVSSWNQKEVKMKREDNRSHVLTNVIEQDYGEGSEYGRAAREEARRKKYGRMAKTYSIDKQPWLLNIKDSSTGKEKNYKSIVDRTGEHADYWIFVKTGKDKFHAHKVNEWYQFLPQVAHKVLDIDQAEEQFQHRSKVMNQFALKAQIQQQLKDADREDGGKTVRGSNLLLKDEASSDDEDGSEGSDAEQKREKKNKKPGKKPKKDKRVRVQDGEEVARYESDDGDDDGMELDYMTDSGSDTDREDKTVDEKVEEQLVGVGEETGLKRDIESGSEDEDEDEDQTEGGKELANRLKEQQDEDSRDKSDDSEEEDLDAKPLTSPLLLQNKVITENDDRKRPADNNSGMPSLKKAKIEPESSTNADVSGPASSADAQQDAMLTDQIRRLLLRRPHTTKELLNIIRPQFERIDKQVLVTKLALVLKSLSAKQYRKNNGKKEVLYFSLES